MEAVLFFLLVFAYQGLTIEIPKPQLLNLEPPDLGIFETIDDPNNITSHEIISWTSVENDDASDPVIGYKLKVWEIKKIKIIKHKFQNGEVVQVVEETYPEIDMNVIPDGVPKEIVTPAGETTATFHDMQFDVAYQFAVLAFTAKGEGRLSAPVRIRLHPSKEMKKGTF